MDLQTAVILEPNRSLLRSYLGKAFADAGAEARAESELTRAIGLDQKDPTPWLYSALLKQHLLDGKLPTPIWGDLHPDVRFTRPSLPTARS